MRAISLFLIYGQDDLADTLSLFKQRVCFFGLGDGQHGTDRGAHFTGFDLRSHIAHKIRKQFRLEFARLAAQRAADETDAFHEHRA